jgi:hypothetical protein
MKITGLFLVPQLASVVSWIIPPPPSCRLAEICTTGLKVIIHVNVDVMRALREAASPTGNMVIPGSSSGKGIFEVHIPLPFIRSLNQLASS